MYKQQVKIITNSTLHSDIHQKMVNDFLAQSIEIVSLQNEVHGGNAHNKYHKAQIVTIITYKIKVDAA